ncbi:MAG TPA: hypothetical protein VFS40_01805 [Gemmatimonadales bacterium]|nr:hypothetical protein [Gemmatimonadales bacterium]
MSAPRRAGLALAAALLVGGCAQTFDATTLGVPVTMAVPAGRPAAATDSAQAFSVTSRAVFGFWGLVPFKKPSLQQALAAQLVGGRGVTNLRIKVRSRWTDVLVTALTGGLVVPRAVTFEGGVTPPAAGGGMP